MTIKKGWCMRVAEAGVFPVTARWVEIWPLMAKAQAQDAASLKSWLWRHRYASWLASLVSDPASCQYCGDLKPTGRAGRLFCSDACRVNAHQASDRGSVWPLLAAALQGNQELELLEVERLDAERWWSDQSRSCGVMPPDLAALDNLPPLPDRCEDGCSGRCFWTQGGPCLFANTAQET